MLEGLEAAAGKVHSAVWLACGLVPLTAVVFIVAEFSWFIAIPPAFATLMFLALFLWTWRVRRRRR
jgi:hypothetical protein